jgi:hypothetical protein
MKWLLESLAMLLEFLFGCRHQALSRVFTIGGQTYQICCDCGARFSYSWSKMSMERWQRPVTIGALGYMHSLSGRD